MSFSFPDELFPLSSFGESVKPLWLPLNQAVCVEMCPLLMHAQLDSALPGCMSASKVAPALRKSVKTSLLERDPLRRNRVTRYPTYGLNRTITLPMISCETPAL